MRVFSKGVAVLLAWLAAAASAAAQQTLSTMPVDAYLHEFRLGASFEGVGLDPDFYYLPTTVPLDRLHKLSFEALFRSPYPDLFRWIGSPKPTVGGALSLTGDTSWVFAGLTWQLPVLETPLFLEATVGATLHNGPLHDAAPGEAVYGCRSLLYVRGGIGYDIDEHWTASAYLEHGSHGRVCGTDNSGFHSVGLQIGYKF
ncbi:acyloxyacyl hydrolase [Devosia sp.]|uniref:acyloxyacyl hydrolase n=1 Tax=Devosia sp. TaxID=1871048 RepID=UPI002EDE3C0D